MKTGEWRKTSLQPMVIGESRTQVGLEEDINFSVASHVIHWGSWLIPRRDWASGIRDFVKARRQG